MHQVAILGGGPMGLSVAYHLAKRGLRPLVLERDAELGGMSASFDFDGVRLERYYHFINLPDHDLFALLRELGMEQEMRWVDTKMGFFRNGRLHPWGNPLALLAFDDVSLLTRLRYGCHAFSCKFITDLLELDDTPASDWIRRWEGNEGYNVLWRTLFEKKFFELADPLSAAWIASRVRRVANSRKSLMREQLGYLEGGSEGLVLRLASEITRMGGEIRTACPVEQVVQTGDTFELTLQHGEPVTAEAVVSTLPLPYVPSIMPFLPSTYADRVRQVRNIGVACALFRLAKPVTQNFWLNVDMPDCDVPGIIEYSNLRPMNAAHVYVPFYMPPTHPNWMADDATLLAKARSYLAAINPEAAATEQAARLFRYEYAQPVCPPGFRKVLPPYSPGIKNLLIADTTHSFPEDRSIQESVRIGKELADELTA